MNSMEKKKRINFLKKINERINQKYLKVDVLGHKYFQQKSGTIFFISEFPGECALVIEYADGIKEAQKNLFEDGDRFYVEDFNNEEDMLQAMIAEIEG